MDRPLAVLNNEVEVELEMPNLSLALFIDSSDISMDRSFTVLNNEVEVDTSLLFCFFLSPIAP